jgi:N-acyl-L-homoserine lactone synthetase
VKGKASRPRDTQALDGVAGLAIAAARPIEFRTARSASEREASFRLRYRVAVESGWITPETIPDGLERDHFDDGAIHVTGWDGETLAATLRLVVPVLGKRLPTEEAFDIAIPDRNSLADWGRIAVVPKYRDAQHRAFWGLMSAAWVEARLCGCHRVVGISSERLILRYRDAGMAITVLGEPKWHWGELRHPMLMDPAASTPTLQLAASRERRD